MANSKVSILDLSDIGGAVYDIDALYLGGTSAANYAKLSATNTWTGSNIFDNSISVNYNGTAATLAYYGLDGGSEFSIAAESLTLQGLNILVGSNSGLGQSTTCTLLADALVFNSSGVWQINGIAGTTGQVPMVQSNGSMGWGTPSSSGSSGSTVSFSRSLTSGTKIGTLTINGTSTILYCKTPPTIYTSSSGTSSTTTTLRIYTDSNGYLHINT